MKKSFSLYLFLVHAFLVALIVVVVWFSYRYHARAVEERNIVEKYRPVMEQVGRELGMDVEIDSFEDLLRVFDEIATKPNR